MAVQDPSKTAAKYEQDYVHHVYDAIAPHFSQTRYKPWPLVQAFLSRQPQGSLGLDVGSGNGKYLHGHNITKVYSNHPQHQPSSRLSRHSPALPFGARPPQTQLEDEDRYLLVGLDRSLALLCHSDKRLDDARNGVVGNSQPEVLNGDCLSLPFRSNLRWDFVISIASLHHLSTHHRRLHALREMLCLLLPRSASSTSPGSLLVFVWAFEQGPCSRRTRAKGTLLPATPPQPNITRDGSSVPTHPHAAQDGQDVLVPWVLNTVSAGADQPAQTFNRFYHLFRQGELIDLVHEAALALQLQLVHSPAQDPSATCPSFAPQRPIWYQILDHGWEADNWWVEVRVGGCGGA